MFSSFHFDFHKKPMLPKVYLVRKLTTREKLTTYAFWDTQRRGLTKDPLMCGQRAFAPEHPQHLAVLALTFIYRKSNLKNRKMEYIFGPTITRSQNKKQHCLLCTSNTWFLPALDNEIDYKFLIAGTFILGVVG